jgi:hypothetical protein
MTERERDPLWVVLAERFPALGLSLEPLEGQGPALDAAPASTPPPPAAGAGAGGTQHSAIVASLCPLRSGDKGDSVERAGPGFRRGGGRKRAVPSLSPLCPVDVPRGEGATRAEASVRDGSLRAVPSHRRARPAVVPSVPCPKGTEGDYAENCSWSLWCGVGGANLSPETPTREGTTRGHVHVEDEPEVCQFVEVVKTVPMGSA